MKKIRLMIVAMFVALGLVVAPQAAMAGGTGDFYKSTRCYALTAGGKVYSTASYLSVSNYDYGSGQQYHFGMKYKSADIAYLPHAIYIDGVQWLGNLTDAYKTYSDRSSRHTFKAEWRAAGAFYLRCYVSNY